jgi:hypothetical protein
MTQGSNKKGRTSQDKNWASLVLKLRDSQGSFLLDQLSHIIA